MNIYDLYNAEVTLLGPTEEHIEVLITKMNSIGFSVVESKIEQDRKLEYSIVFSDKEGYLNIKFSSSHLNPVTGLLTRTHPWYEIIKKTRGIREFSLGRWMDTSSTTESRLDFRSIKTIIERVQKFKTGYSNEYLYSTSCY